MTKLFVSLVGIIAFLFATLRFSFNELLADAAHLRDATDGRKLAIAGAVVVVIEHGKVTLTDPVGDCLETRQESRSECLPLIVAHHS